MQGVPESFGHPVLKERNRKKGGQMQDEASGLMMLSKKVTETTMCNLLNALLSSWVSFAEKQEEIEVLVMLSG